MAIFLPPGFRYTTCRDFTLLTVAILERRALAISVLVRAWRVQLPYSHHQLDTNWADT